MLLQSGGGEIRSRKQCLVTSMSMAECSLFTIPHYSLDQRSPAVGLHSSPWNTTVTAGQLIRLCLGGSWVGFVLDGPMGAHAQRQGVLRDWGPVGLVIKSKMSQDRYVMAGVEVMPKSGTHTNEVWHPHLYSVNHTLLSEVLQNWPALLLFTYTCQFPRLPLLASNLGKLRYLENRL